MANVWARTKSIGRKHLWLPDDDPDCPLATACGLWGATAEVLQSERDAEECEECHIAAATEG